MMMRFDRRRQLYYGNHVMQHVLSITVIITTCHGGPPSGLVR
jgi:hypothetical protein